MITTKLSLLAIIASSTVASASGDAWASWKQLSHTRCPSHHVEWMNNDAYMFLVEGFDATLERAQKRNVDRIANTERECVNTWGGLRCEATRHIIAYERLGLMSRFVGYGCRHIKCEESSICSRAPDS